MLLLPMYRPIRSFPNVNSTEASAAPSHAWRHAIFTGRIYRQSDDTEQACERPLFRLLRAFQHDLDGVRALIAEQSADLIEQLLLGGLLAECERSHGDDDDQQRSDREYSEYPIATTVRLELLYPETVPVRV